jgi:hypothetical protein
VPIKQYAYLWIESEDEAQDWDPAEVSRRLGVEATEAHRRNDLMPGGRRRRRTHWHWGASETEDNDWQDLLEPVLAQSRSRARQLEGVRRDLHLTAGLMIVVRMLPEKTFAGRGDEDAWGVPTPASQLTAEHIRDMANLGLGVEIDMYVSTPDDVRDE